MGLIASMLCSANESIDGQYVELWHFVGKVAVFPMYLEDKYPPLSTQRHSPLSASNSTVMAASEWLIWTKRTKTWGDVTGVKTSYKQTTVEDLEEHAPGGAGKETGETFEFSLNFAYNCFQANTLKIWDLEKVSNGYTVNVGSGTDNGRSDRIDCGEYESAVVHQVRRMDSFWDLARGTIAQCNVSPPSA